METVSQIFSLKTSSALVSKIRKTQHKLSLLMLHTQHTGICCKTDTFDWFKFLYDAMIQHKTNHLTK